MPQPSVSYACGRVGVLWRTALRKAQLERLISAHSYADAMRALADIGFCTPDCADFQAAADAHVLKACELIRAVSPAPLMTDCFLYRYDAHNLKVLFKSRHLAQKPQFLSRCGTLGLDKLRHAVTERSYAALPTRFRDAMKALERSSAIQMDPMLADAVLDQAAMRQALDNLAQCGDNGTALAYFRAKADLQNMVMLLRLKAMGMDATAFASVALEGGNIPITGFARQFAETDRFARQLQRYGGAVYQAALAASLDAARLPKLEKAADDYLYSLFRDYRYQADAPEMLIYYLLQRQREATDVRLILAGKLNGFTPEAVAERVREVHG